ncbi:hypothetical protein [Bacillus sp. 2205SS5-2]|uniref:hypothetical protein n=1 Tax=Bacillus sp. 2205SS5-2 TaxID=3109031 RepID=UPI003004A0C5
MKSKRHFVFNFSLISLSWISLLFIGKQNFKRYSISGVFIIIFEFINHLFAQNRKWWVFYDKPKSFLKEELPFSMGPAMPLSMWILKFSFGNFKKFVLLNVLADGLFAFFFIDVLKKLKIARLERINHLQFFLYLHYKAYLLYGVQWLVEKRKKDESWEQAESSIKY